MSADRRIRKRVRRHLDCAWCKGAFDVNGSLAGLSAEAIADGIAAEWDGGDRGKMDWKPGTSDLDAATLVPHVEAWMEHNDL